MNRATRTSSTRAPLGQRSVNIENQNHIGGGGSSKASSAILLPSKKDVVPASSTSNRSNSNTNSLLLQRQPSAATTASITGNSDTLTSSIGGGGGEANRAFNSLSSETLRNVINSASSSTATATTAAPVEMGMSKLPTMKKTQPLATHPQQQANIIVRSSSSSDAPTEKKCSNNSTSVISKSPTTTSSSDQQVTIVEHRKRPCGDGFTVHTYLRGKLLGKGGFAKVYKVTSLDTNKEYAVKIVPKANLVKSRARQKVRDIDDFLVAHCLFV
jgi:hypothetical protein